jgi:WhiB family redox-sensing transcriptional regulator
MPDLIAESTFAASLAYPPFLADGIGACAGDPAPDDFTEDRHRHIYRDLRERARQVCYGCPFVNPCREWALATYQQGMYGATTTQERRVLRRRAGM